MNVLRALIYNEEVSLTMADTTSLANEGIQRHGLSGEGAIAFARTLSALTFMSACLKERSGEISLAFRTDGKILNLGASGNAELAIRGYLDWHDEGKSILGEGSLTVVRDDGYNRPFVGACEVASKEDIDNSFEDYYFTSEQLPTFIKTILKRDGAGEVEFCGIIVAQPLPFASEETFAKIPDSYELEKILNENGQIDAKKLDPITYDSSTHTYWRLGDAAGKAFAEGKKIK
jgi:redox-regulated HSP33 family molecular chaperone